jgi:large subunit ribosomal protein L10
MATEAKVREVEEFSEILHGATSVVLTDFTGLDVASVSELRRKCRAAGVHYRVIKNTFARRVIAQHGMESRGTFLEGPNARARIIRT